MYTPNERDRVAIFIDGENIHYSAKHMNMRLDYLKMCRKLAGPRRLVRAYFYTALSTQSEGKIDFVNFLKLNGFTVVTKEVKSFNDQEGGRNVRSCLDMELAINVMELSEQPGHGDPLHRRRRLQAADRGRGARGASTWRCAPCAR